MQDVLLSQATANLCKMGFETVQDSDGKTLLNGTMTATARWIKADGTSTAAAGTFTQPDSTDAPGARYYQPTTGELNTMGAALLRISGTVGGVTFRTRTLQIDVTAFTKHDGVRAGLTALPNANAGASGGVLRGTNGNTLTVDAGGNGFADVRGWLGIGPNVLVTGRVDASVGAMAANVLTAAAVATNAIDADALAADAVTKIAAQITTDHGTGSYVDTGAGGDATLANQTTIIGYVDTLEAEVAAVKTRLPVALVGGRMDSSVGAIVDGVITATKFAADAITSTVLATSAAEKVRDTILNTVLRTGWTVRGLLRKAYAWHFGKVTGQPTSATPTTVTAFQPDGVTPEFTVAIDPAAGTRQASSVEV